MYYLDSIAEPLTIINFEREIEASYGEGWKEFKELANVILSIINKHNRDTLKLYGEREKLSEKLVYSIILNIFQ